jgi:hypothetical protein
VLLRRSRSSASLAPESYAKRYPLVGRRWRYGGFRTLAKMPDKSSNPFRVAGRGFGSGFGSDGIADVLGATKFLQQIEHLENC